LPARREPRQSHGRERIDLRRPLHRRADGKIGRIVAQRAELAPDAQKRGAASIRRLVPAAALGDALRLQIGRPAERNAGPTATESRARAASQRPATAAGDAHTIAAAKSISRWQSHGARLKTHAQ
jgi:hypothetical protein